MCLHVKGHILFFQRTQLWFPTPVVGHTYPPRIVVTGSQMPSPGLCRAHTHLCTHSYRHTHISMNSLVLFFKNT